MSRTRSVLAWLCILLLLVTGSVHLLHTHPQGDDSASPTCGLCAVAHLSILPVPVAQQPVIAHTFTAFDPQTAQAPPPTRFLHPSLYVRPPPVLTSQA